MNCIILEKDKKSFELLQNYCNYFDDLHVVSTGTDFNQAIQYIHETKVDVVFLNVDQYSPQDQLKLEALEYKPHLVFITQKGMDFRSSSVINKPLSFSEFSKIVWQLRHAIDPKKMDGINVISSDGKSSNNRFILYLDTAVKTYKINMLEIVYIQSLKTKLKIVTDKNIYMIDGVTIDNLEESLSADRFFRVHEKFIVNTAKINSLLKRKVVLEKIKIPIPLKKEYRNGLVSRIGMSVN